MTRTKDDQEVVEFTAIENTTLSSLTPDFQRCRFLFSPNVWNKIIDPPTKSAKYHKFWKELLKDGAGKGWQSMDYALFFARLSLLHGKLSRLPTVTDIEFKDLAGAVANELATIGGSLKKLGLKLTVDDIARTSPPLHLTTAVGQMPVRRFLKRLSAKVGAAAPPARESKQAKRHAMNIGVAFVRLWSEIFGHVPSNPQVENAFELLWKTQSDHASEHSIEIWRGIVTRGARKKVSKNKRGERPPINDGADRLEEALAPGSIKARAARRTRKTPSSRAHKVLE